MNIRDPKLTALLFNECINNRDVRGLSSLMANDHKLIVREGTVVAGKDANTKAWTSFFEMFPEYRNTFMRIESRENLVVIVGFAYWNQEKPYDQVIWTARVENDHIAEWRIFDDTAQVRATLGVT